jgi:hypothetical protein
VEAHLHPGLRLGALSAGALAGEEPGAGHRAAHPWGAAHVGERLRLPAGPVPAGFRLSCAARLWRLRCPTTTATSSGPCTASSS